MRLPWVIEGAAPRKRRQAGLMLALAFSTSLALAADVVHSVQDGDTLYDIANTYLADPQQWPELARVNGNPDPLRLPLGSVITVPESMLRNKAGGAVALHVSGNVTHIRADGAREPLAAGMRLIDGESVSTSRNGFATLELADGSLVRITGDSDVQLERLKYVVSRKRADTQIDVSRGRVESTVPPQRASGSRFRISTPLMAAGVRGTRFGVSVGADGHATSDVLSGEVEVIPHRGARRAVRVSAGKGNVTTAQRGVAAPTALLSAPDLSALPAVQQRPLLDVSFPAVSGAQAYRAYVSLDAALYRVEANDVVPTPRVRFDTLDDGDYVVVVRAIDAQGVEGEPATRALRLKARPEPPITQGPTHESVVEQNSTTLSWTTAMGATAYDVQVARDAGFGTLVHEHTALTQTTLDLRDLASGDYYWRIRTHAPDRVGNADLGPFGDARRFSIRPAMGGASLEQTLDEGVVFRWDGEPGQRFRLQLAHDAAFANMAHQLDTTEPQTPSLTLPGGDYFLRYQATDADGYVRKFSSTQQVRVVSYIGTAFGGALRASDGSGILRQ